MKSKQVRYGHIVQAQSLSRIFPVKSVSTATAAESPLNFDKSVVPMPSLKAAYPSIYVKNGRNRCIAMPPPVGSASES